MAGFIFGAFVFHADRRQLLRGEREVHLTRKAFDLLAMLVERAPAVVPKAEIHARLWPDTFVSDDTLVGLVKEVRRALSDDHRGTVVRTAHGVGYAFDGGRQGDAPGPPARAMTFWLVAGARRFPLREGVNTIGRDPDSTVWLDVAGISRRHAQIVVEKGSASLEDLGSKNGTRVAERLVEGRVDLRESDRIEFGGEAVVFHASPSGMPTLTQSRTGRQ
jgi:DNA-binding winged helix-turn-helix (wHTH) protein